MTETAKKTLKNTNENLDALVLVKVWFEGWKKTFTLEGRSSRFELWTFILLNSILAIIAQLRCSYIMSDRFITDAHAQGYTIERIESNIIIAEIVFAIATLLPFAYISDFSFRIYSGNIIGTDIIQGLIIQITWLFIIVILGMIALIKY